MAWQRLATTFAGAWLATIPALAHAAPKPRPAAEHDDARRTEHGPAPPPDDAASGIARPARKPGHVLLWVPRTVLYLPRRVIALALTPVRVGMWAFERYNLEERYHRTFFFRRGVAGLYPSVRFSSGFGANVGMRMIHRDLFHRGVGLGLFAMYGQRFGQRFELTLRSPPLAAGVLGLGAMLEYRDVPADRFFGIGNTDLVTVLPEHPIDPFRRDTAVATRFTHMVLRTGPVATLRLTGTTRLALSSTFAWRRFARADRLGDEMDTAAAFDRRNLVGYETGVTNVYTQLRWDLDRRRHRHTVALTSSGWRAAAYGGYAFGLGDDPSRFGRVGLDLQRYIDLWNGNRVLLLRGVADAAIGPYRRIPFVELPALGGPYYLRGYPRDRFRDRVTAFGTAEYTHAVDRHIAAFAFVEPGGAWSGPGDLGAAPVRLGYGGGIQLHTERMFLARLQLASSIDGGFNVDFNFSPAFEPRDRR